MKRQTKFSQEQEHVSEAQSQQTTARDFSSVEEMLRYDAKQAVVPPAVGQRLAESIQSVPQPKSSWRRWLGF